MNVIAGLLIGVLNDNWLAYILVPFVWGIIFVFYQYITGKVKLNRKIIFIEYATAVTTSLFFSIVIAILKWIF